MKIIAFGKRCGVGKDTAGLYLRRKLAADTPILKFALGVREACEALLSIPVSEMWTTAHKAQSLESRAFSKTEFHVRVEFMIAKIAGIAPSESLLAKFQETLRPKTTNGFLCLPYTLGELLQIVGTDCFRKLISEDFWVDRLLKQLSTLHSAYVIITDLKYPNEAAALKKRGAILVEIQRAACDDSLAGRSQSHESETQRFEVDVVIENNGTLSEFYQSLDRFIAEK